MFNKILIANRGEIACRVAAHRAPPRRAHRRRLLGRRCAGRATCMPATRRCTSAAARRERQLPAVAAHPRRRASHRRAGGAPRLRLPERERGLRARLCRRRAGLHRPAGRRDRRDGQQGGRQVADGTRPACRWCRAITAATTTRRCCSAEAERIGFPVLIKASAGGGGRACAGSSAADDFAAALASCQREAQSQLRQRRMCWSSATSRGRATSRSRSSATRTATCVYLFERDCSVQRRHQKVLEEAPAPGMSAERRAEMGAAAVAAARAVGYVGAGTVEFIVEPSGRRRPALLFHGDEHPAAGRAPGDRGDHRPRPGRVAAARRLRRAAAAAAGRAAASAATRSRRASAPRTPTPTSCRPPARSQVLRWPAHVAFAAQPPAHRARAGAGADRRRRARRRRDQPVLRLDDRQADRLGRGPRSRRWRGSTRRCAQTHIVGLATNVAFLRRVVGSRCLRRAPTSTPR